MTLSVFVCFALYFPLLRNLAELRPLVVEFLLRSLLPIALVHILCCLVVSAVFSRRASAAMLFWCVSLIGLLVLGGPRHAAAFLWLAATGLALVIVGDGPAGAIFPSARRSWGLRLGAGVLSCSFVGSLLCVSGLFSTLSAAVVFTILVGVGLSRRGRLIAHDARSDWRALCSRWDLSTSLAGEGIFLLTAFAFVGASAPELRSDAVRFYWPYVRLLGRFGGFFDIPSQWSFVIPQAGLTYSAVFGVAGLSAVRYSMLLPLLALLGMVSARSASGCRAASLALALVVASCPVILWTSLSLYQEAFVSLCVVLLALVCIEGERPASPSHLAGVGALVGMSWCAKYSSLAYAAPLLLVALVRFARVATTKGALRAVGICTAACGLTAAPWLYHVWRGTGNPLFPFLLELMPARTWPQDLGIANLGDFALRPGLIGLLAAPAELTLRTDRFVEGPPGSLGIVLPLLLILATVVMLWGRAEMRAWLFAGFVGTALLWRTTAYVRYWLPGIWLVAMACPAAVNALATSSRRTAVVCVVALTLTLCHLPFVMVMTWSDSVGWPWDVYGGTVEEEDYLFRIPGFAALRRLEAADPTWPKICQTGTGLVGHINAVPFEAVLWEFRLHGVRDEVSLAQHVESAGCDYWVVDADTPAAADMQMLARDRFWTDHNRIDSEGSIEVYRISNGAKAVTPREPGSPAFGSELVANGGFEEGEGDSPRSWHASGDVRWYRSASDAPEGQHLIEVGSGGVVTQAVPLPAGARTVQLRQWMRSRSHAAYLNARLQINWLRDARLLSTNIAVVRVGTRWKEFKLTSRVPTGAASAMIYLLAHEPGGPLTFDDVRLASIDEAR